VSKLGDWWRRVTGRTATAAPHPRPAARPAPSSKPASDELALADHAAPKRPSRTGAAGFDPYSSDAGYAKPHSWERLDHD